jgi:hypothetical protein
MNPYVYMFVRGDLSHPQQIVQTAHAVDEIGRRHKSDGTNYMVLCDAPDEQFLFDTSDWLTKHGIDHHVFHEPDINGHTAIATEPLIGDRRKPMRRFKTKK